MTVIASIIANNGNALPRTPTTPGYLHDPFYSASYAYFEWSGSGPMRIITGLEELTANTQAEGSPSRAAHISFGNAPLMPLTMNWIPKASVIRPNTLLSTSIPVSPR